MKDEVIVSTRIERRHRDALVQRSHELNYRSLSQFLRRALEELASGRIEEIDLADTRRHDRDEPSKNEDPLDALVRQLFREEKAT